MVHGSIKTNKSDGDDIWEAGNKADNEKPPWRTNGSRWRSEIYTNERQKRAEPQTQHE